MQRRVSISNIISKHVHDYEVHVDILDDVLEEKFVDEVGRDGGGQRVEGLEDLGQPERSNSQLGGTESVLPHHLHGLLAGLQLGGDQGRPGQEDEGVPQVGGLEGGQAGGLEDLDGGEEEGEEGGGEGGLAGHHLHLPQAQSGGAAGEEERQPGGEVELLLVYTRQQAERRQRLHQAAVGEENLKIFKYSS